MCNMVHIKFFFFKRFIFFGKKTIVDSIQGNYVVQWGRGNMGILLIKTMTSSSYFVALAKSKAARLHRNGVLSKEKKKSLIKLMSSMILATSKEKTLSEFKRSNSLAKLHSTITFEKLVL